MIFLVNVPKQRVIILVQCPLVANLLRFATIQDWIEKRTWREINDILRLSRFCWLKNGKEGCWIRLKQRNLIEFL